jgi:excisionase family DNA binding protein
MPSRTAPISTADIDPLVVTPRAACRLLSLGNTRLYELIRRRELDSYRDGRARRITMASIRAYVARHFPADVASTEPQRRRPGRPRKAVQAGTAA